MVCRPRRPGRKLQDQPVDVELGDERQLAEQARIVVVHPVGDRQGLVEQGRRSGKLRGPGPKVGVRHHLQARRCQPGYLEAFETVIGSSKIQFTPQKKFFDTTKDWAVALQDIYGGEDAASRLRSLAKTNTSKINL